ncbi:MAG: EI24 domain-containing protein [Pirellulales bacterium]|nr:EI24 domain-containing protein [Pirellulales bacterium]
MQSTRTTPAAFWEGLSSPWNGCRYMWRQPGLWRFGLKPFLANLLVSAVFLVVLVGIVGYSLVTLHTYYSDGWLGWALEVLVAVLVLIVAMGISFVVWLILQDIFCGHYYAKLAEQVELQLGMKPEDIRDVSVVHQLRDTFSDVAFLLGVNGGFLLLNFVPGIGSAIGAAGSYYFTCMTLGCDFLEHPLSLRGKRRSERLAFARRHRAHTLGLGTGVAVVSLVPFLNAVLLTTAVTGAVLLHRQLIEDDPDRSSV